MEAMHLLKRDECAVIIIDTQEKLHKVIADSHQVMDRVAVLARAARTLGVPIVLTEQYPKGVGPTVDDIRQAAGAEAPIIEKREFGCFANGAFEQAMEPYRNKTLVLCGFETHVCVCQTALQARALGHRVVVVADAVSSRCPSDRHIGLERMRLAGCILVSVEMLCFEWLGTSTDPEFKAISALIK